MTFLYFGGTGDLAKSRILPFLKELSVKNVFALGRRYNDRESFVQGMGIDFSELDYIKYSIGEGEGGITEKINKVEDKSLLVCFVAVFNGDKDSTKSLCKDLKEIIKNSSFKKVRVLVDKPIGKSKSSSLDIMSYFSELDAEIIYIDHYLEKKYTKNNLNDVLIKYNEDIVFKATETKTIEGREKFWESTGGIVNDMIQSHVLMSIRKFTGIDLCIEKDSINIIDCQTQKLENGDLLKQPLFIDVSMKHKCKETNVEKSIRLVVGKIQNKKETYFVNREKNEFIDFSTEQPCKAYKRIIEKAYGNSLKSIPKEIIKDNWEISENINDSSMKFLFR